MKTNITKEDVLALREELNKYIEKSTPQEAEGLGLALISVGGAIYLFDKLSTEELNRVFRGVYKVIGKDFSEYKEEEEIKWKHSPPTTTPSAIQKGARKKNPVCGTSPTARHRKRNTRTASRYSIGKNWNQNVICM